MSLKNAEILFVFSKEDRKGEEMMIVKRKLYVMVCNQGKSQHNVIQDVFFTTWAYFTVVFSKTAGSLYNQTPVVPVAKTTLVPYDFLQPHDLHTALF